MRYRAEYRSELDRRHKSWDPGIRRDRMVALAALNEMTDRSSGTFSFDEPPGQPVTQRYILIEWEEGKQFARRTLRQLYLRK